VQFGGLRLRALAKSFGRRRVLDALDLDVAEGDLVTVLGASGSGKTTLLRLLCGFERADGGSIELAGRVVAHDRRLHVSPEKRGIGYVAQEGALFPHLSVEKNIVFGLPRRLRKFHRAAHAARNRRVRELLDLLDLPAHYARRMPAQLSGGEQQRVALARALAPDPAVVLLDEPFSALDAGLRADTREAVAASLRRIGATAILVTHDQDEALSIGDRVAVLQNGRIAQADSAQALYRFPVNRDVARFVGDAVLVTGTLLGECVDCCFGRLPLAPETGRGIPAGEAEVEVMIRPEQFRLKGAGVADAARARQARVEQLSFYGHDARITLRLEQGLEFSASVPGINLPAMGATVAFDIVGPVVVYPRRRNPVQAPLLAAL
jgi:iron(III) transport system ATP-binding protein